MDFLADINYQSAQFGTFYDELPLWSAPFGLLLLERVPLRPDLVILDVGAGTGFLALELAQRCGLHSKVFAVDPWPSGMARLRSRVDFLGLKNVVLMEQDAARLDLADEVVDLIVSNLGINNFENPEAVLHECWRVARPGAKLFLTTNLTGHMAEFYEIFRATLVELGLTNRLPGLNAHIQHRGTVESVTLLLEQSGFKPQLVTTDSFKLRFADGSALLRHYFIRLGFMGAWKALLPADALEQTFSTLERNLNVQAASQGELALTIPVACFEAQKF